MLKLLLKKMPYCLLSYLDGNNEQSKHQKGLEKSTFDASFVD